MLKKNETNIEGVKLKTNCVKDKFCKGQSFRINEQKFLQTDHKWTEQTVSLILFYFHEYPSPVRVGQLSAAYGNAQYGLIKVQQ